MSKASSIHGTRSKLAPPFPSTLHPLQLKGTSRFLFPPFKLTQHLQLLVHLHFFLSPLCIRFKLKWLPYNLLLYTAIVNIVTYTPFTMLSKHITKQKAFHWLPVWGEESRLEPQHKLPLGGSSVFCPAVGEEREMCV